MIIREIKKSDIGEVANLHLRCLPDTVSSRLGKFYLEKIYKIFSKYSNNSAFVMVDKDKIIGAIGLTADLNQFQLQIKKELALTDYLLIIKSIILLRITITDLLRRIIFERELVKNYQVPYKAIVTSFVDKNYRRQGVATKLLKSAIRDDKNLTKIFYVDTLAKNSAAIKFYENFGFSPVTKLKDSILLSFIKQNKI